MANINDPLIEEVSELLTGDLMYVGRGSEDKKYDGGKLATKEEISSKDEQRKIRLMNYPTIDWVDFDIVKYVDKAYISRFDWLNYFLDKYSGLIGGGEIWVDPSNGDDTNTGVIGQPLQTLNAAMSANPSRIYLHNGEYDPIDFRDTSPQGHKAKILIGVGDEVYFRRTGDDVSSLTWASNVTYPLVYEATLTTDNHVNRLLRTDVLDNDGRGTPIPERADLATVNSSGYGWYYDTATKVLYVRFDNVASDATRFNDFIRTRLNARYKSDVGTEQRFYLQNTKVFFKNIKIEGIYIFGNKTAATAAGVRPTIWADNCEMLYAPSAGFTMEGAECFVKNTYVTRSNGDNFGYHVENGVECQAVEFDVVSTYPGDVDTYPATTANKNCSSMHENGDILRLNGQYTDAYPYNIVDTGTGGTSTGQSINIGCFADRIVGGIGQTVIMYDRTVYLDHVQAPTIQAADNSEIIYNDLVVNTLDTIGGGTLTEFEF